MKYLIVAIGIVSSNLIFTYSSPTNTFSANTVISSTDVNTNFNELYSRMPVKVMVYEVTSAYTQVPGFSNNGTCKDSSSSTIISPNNIAGTFTSGQEVSISLPVQSGVIIKVVGVVSNSTCPPIESLFINTTELTSAPYTLANLTIDITPGVQTINLVGTLGSEYAQSCTGGPFSTSSNEGTGSWDTYFWDSATWGP
jgi:hypothetical protein